MSALQEAIALRQALARSISETPYITPATASVAADRLLLAGWVTGHPDGADEPTEVPADPNLPPTELNDLEALDAAPEGVVYTDRTGDEWVKVRGRWYATPGDDPRNWLPLELKA